MEPRESRRPISEQEQVVLARLGALIQAKRTTVGLSQARLAKRAMIGERHLRNLECGRRRTRASTLHRVASGLAGDDVEATAALHAQMVEAAAHALAPESDFSERVERRRQRRYSRSASVWIPSRVSDFELAHQGLVERRVRYWNDGARRRRQRVTYWLASEDGVAMSRLTADQVSHLFDGRPLPQP